MVEGIMKKNTVGQGQAALIQFKKKSHNRHDRRVLWFLKGPNIKIMFNVVKIQKLW